MIQFHMLNPDFDKFQKIIDQYSMESSVEELKSLILGIDSRRMDQCKALHGSIGTNLERISEHSIVLAQINLIRFDQLLRRAIDAQIGHDPLTVALTARAFLESFSALLFLHKKLSQLTVDKSKSYEIRLDIAKMLMGSRDKAMPDGSKWDPHQVLTMIDHADRTLSRIIPEIGKGVIRGEYDFLSETCHPNFNSNSLFFRLDPQNGIFEFRHKMMLEAREVTFFGPFFLFGTT